MTNAQEIEGEWKGQATASKHGWCHSHKDDIKPRVRKGNKENGKGEDWMLLGSQDTHCGENVLRLEGERQLERDARQAGKLEKLQERDL